MRPTEETSSASAIANAAGSVRTTRKHAAPQQPAIAASSRGESGNSSPQDEGAETRNRGRKFDSEPHTVGVVREEGDGREDGAQVAVERQHAVTHLRETHREDDEEGH